mmetsp:Transcript_23494/g.45011  ORF Transcript_23494/g.45011 Transcript_23494/m.45011 type:complete len:168 (+) Transcript_23494:3-506(+)
MFLRRLAQACLLASASCSSREPRPVKPPATPHRDAMTQPDAAKPEESRPRASRAASPAARKPVEAAKKKDAAEGTCCGAPASEGKKKYLKVLSMASALIATILILLWAMAKKKVPFPSQTITNVASWLVTHKQAIGVTLLTVVAVVVVGFTVKHIKAKKAAAKEKAV